MRAFGHVCELEFPVAGWFGDSFGRIKEDLSANFRAVITNALIEVELVAVLGLVDGFAGFRNRFVQVVSEVSSVFPGGAGASSLSLYWCVNSAFARERTR